MQHPRHPRRRLRGRNTRKALINRERGRLVCTYCRRSVARDKAVGDHAIPLSRGGRDRMDNIVVACRDCDHLKACLTAEEFMAVRDDHKARKALIKSIEERLRGVEHGHTRRAADRRGSR